MWSATKTSERVGIGIFAVILDCGQLFFVLAAGVQLFTPRMKNTWNGAIKRRRAGAVENLVQLASRQDQMSYTLKSRTSAGTSCSNMASRQRLRKNDFVAHENVSRTQLLAFHLGHKTVSRAKPSHS